MQTLFFIGIIFVLGAFMEWLSPQAGIAIGLALSLQDQSGFKNIAPLILNVIIATTVVHEFFGPVFIKYILRKSGESGVV